MKKSLFIIFQFAFLVSQSQTAELRSLPVPTTAQLKNVNELVDSLRSLLTPAREDTTKIRLLLLLEEAYRYKRNRDSSFLCSQQALALSEKINDLTGAVDARMRLAFLFEKSGNYAKALELSLTNLSIIEQHKDTLRLFFTIRVLSWVYADMSDFTRQIEFVKKLQQLARSGYFKKEESNLESFGLDLESFNEMSLLNLGGSYKNLNSFDSALYYYQLSYKTALSANKNEGLALSTGGLADVSLKLGKTAEAWSYYHLAIGYATAANRPELIAGAHLGLAKIFQQKGQLDSAIYYGKLAMNGFQRSKSPADEFQTASFLDELYTDENRMDSAHHYLALAVTLRDSLFNQEKIKQVQNLQFAETLRQQQTEQERKAARQQFAARLKIYSLIGGLVVVLLVSYFLYRNNKQKQNVNLLLRQKNDEIQNALTELRSTQAQLIQSEKMASLGELTAGIAHEIQNPLNFVNNFSEVNNELVDELKSELAVGNLQSANEIANNIKDNGQKINHHGRRADNIVKGMLQHSRTSSGNREMTDLNALCDEYFRLAYHGLRAKDKNFNAEIKTDFDSSVGTVSVVRQDIGRVILNLINNAFYAVNEKAKQNIAGYKPMVKVETRKTADKVWITVADNGNGVPQNIIDKIFQPFFTTKPTGQGTGLGLSLAYDIVKAHGGELKVEAKESQGSEFIIQLPLNNAS